MGASIADTNPTSAVALTLGRDTMRTLTANPIAPTVPISKAVLGFRDPSTMVLGPGNTFGISTVSTGAGSAELWTCNSGSNVVTGSAAVCDQLAPTATRQRAGYTWTTLAATGSAAAAPLWVCNFSGAGTTVVVKAVTNAQCNASGQPQAGVPLEQLGFVLTGTPTGSDSTRTAQPIGNLVQSFTTGAWVKPGTGGSTAAVATNTNTSGVELGATSTSWQFCLRPSAGAIPVCATAARPADGDWTHISGVWDATNGQIRLYINAALAGTASFNWPGGTSSSPQVMHVGASVSGTTVASRWSGQIADPAVFAGVATASQPSLLRSGQDPVNG